MFSYIPTQDSLEIVLLIKVSKYLLNINECWASEYILGDHRFVVAVAKSCPTVCNPWDYSAPGFPVLHYLLEFAQTHAHCINDAIQPSHPLLPPSPPGLQSFSASESFPMSWFFASGGQCIGASISATVFPMYIQGWFPLVFTVLISLLCKGLSRVFFSTTVQKHQFLCPTFFMIQSLKKEMETHSSILAWEIPWTDEPGRLQSMGLQELDTM